MRRRAAELTRASRSGRWRRGRWRRGRPSRRAGSGWCRGGLAGEDLAQQPGALHAHLTWLQVDRGDRRFGGPHRLAVDAGGQQQVLAHDPARGPDLGEDGRGGPVGGAHERVGLRCPGEQLPYGSPEYGWRGAEGCRVLEPGHAAFCAPAGVGVLEGEGPVEGDVAGEERGPAGAPRAQMVEEPGHGRLVVGPEHPCGLPVADVALGGDDRQARVHQPVDDGVLGDRVAQHQPVDPREAPGGQQGDVEPGVGGLFGDPEHERHVVLGVGGELRDVQSDGAGDGGAQAAGVAVGRVVQAPGGVQDRPAGRLGHPAVAAQRVGGRGRGDPAARATSARVAGVPGRGGVRGLLAGGMVTSRSSGRRPGP